MAAQLLQVEHYVRKLLYRNFIAFIKLAEVIVLAIDTFHIAMREEDCPRSTRTRDRRLFTVMGLKTVDHRIGRSPAISELSGDPVDTALTRAYLTFFK